MKNNGESNLGGKVDEKKGRTVWGKALPDLLFDSPRNIILFWFINVFLLTAVYNSKYKIFHTIFHTRPHKTK